MKVRTCKGCGRMLGLRTGVECPCWRSHNRGTVIPRRLASITNRVVAFHREGGKDTREAEALRALTEVR